MRVRLVTFTPLPPLKAWFVVDISKCKKVLDLKRSICLHVEALRSLSINPEDVVLVMDEWDLLPESAVGVIRDGEIVGIKLHVPSLGKQVQLEHPTSKKRKYRSETTSSDEPTSSSASDSSDTSSDSSTNTDSESSSSPRTSPTFLPILRKATPEQPLSRKKQNHVPPGQGKPSTRSRNLRRRARKQLVKADNMATSANAHPLGTASFDPAPVQGVERSQQELEQNPTVGTFASGLQKDHSNTPAHTLMMESLKTKNKNKRKALRASRAVPRARIVFADVSKRSKDIEGCVTLVPSNGVSPEIQLKPPSEKQALGQLPQNVFVTSHRCNEKRGHRARASLSEPEAELGGGPSHHQPSLTNGQPVVEHRAVEDQESANDIDFDAARRAWDTYELIKENDQLKVGLTVGWEALELNEETWTPEMVINLASIVEVGNGEIIKVEAIYRPGKIVDEEGCGQPGEHPWADVLSMNWRIIN